MPMASAMKPNQSKRIAVCFLVSSMNSIRPSTVTMPTGRLIRNTQCHEYRSVRKPPSAGPRIGPQHHAHAPDRHGLAALLGRIGVEHHRLRQRHERGAERALQQPREHHGADVLRRGAQQRGEGEPAQQMTNRRFRP
jgi:hypothetical protein